MMNKNYGTNRVLEPKHVLPTSAWKLDNSPRIRDDEIRVKINRIHVEDTSFKEICLDANDNDEKIKQKIVDIVIGRGKFHNPVTDTGGLFYGTVEEIGKDYYNPKGFKVGDLVICNASMASVPAYIDKVKKIDRAYGQVDVEGYAILYSQVPLIRKPEDVPINLLLFTFNQSGTLYRISNTAIGKKKFLVVGNNLLSNILFGYAIRKVADDSAEVICILDKKTDAVLKGEQIEKLVRKIFTSVHYVDILKPLECLEVIGESQYDVSVNCADIPGAETINLLATKSGGSVVFANLINNYNISLYITESISKQLDIRCADGYLEAYDRFDIQLVKELAPYVEKAHEINDGVGDDSDNAISIKRRLKETDIRKGNDPVENMVFKSHAMSQVYDEILNISKYDCHVLVTGETGVGKEKVANLIHKNSNRKMQPLIKVNCAAISPNLMESEFFGYEKGAFTGASNSGKKGFFELADNGTLFLDEIGEVSMDMQAKLLRVIQDGEFFRVGGHSPIKTNVRIISATNRNIRELIEEGKFRKDLHYRLEVMKVRVPTLRERSADIPGLVDNFILKYGKKFAIKRDINDDAMDYLCKCKWPGNIRELENMVQRLMVSSKGESITLMDVMQQIHGEVFDVRSDVEIGEREGEFKLSRMVESLEKNIIKQACDKYGSTRKAAKAIGISQTQLVRKKNKYKIG